MRRIAGGDEGAGEASRREPAGEGSRLSRVKSISIAGVTTSVSTVEKARPKTMALDSEIHHCVDGAPIVVSRFISSRLSPKAIGNTPRIAVAAVSTTGRARSRQVCRIAWTLSAPSWRSWS